MVPWRSLRESQRIDSGEERGRENSTNLKRSTLRPATSRKQHGLNTAFAHQDVTSALLLTSNILCTVGYRHQPSDYSPTLNMPLVRVSHERHTGGALGTMVRYNNVTVHKNTDIDRHLCIISFYYSMSWALNTYKRACFSFFYLQSQPADV